MKPLRKCISPPNSDPSIEIPSCVQDVNECSEDSSVPNRTQHERLLNACREYSTQYKEIQEKYYESIYSTAEKIMRNSQTNQMKQLKTSLDRVANEVMHQLREARRNEVKNLASVHRNRDELTR